MMNSKKLFFQTAMVGLAVLSATALADVQTFEGNGGTKSEACTHAKHQAQFWADGGNVPYSVRTPNGRIHNFGSCDCEIRRMSGGYEQTVCSVDAYYTPNAR